jgi:hypothetical protein
MDYPFALKFSASVAKHCIHELYSTSKLFTLSEPYLAMSWIARFPPRHFARAQKLRHAKTFLSLANRRSFVTFETFTEGFLDLAIALPYPESFPPYSTTIILVAVVSRLLFTVPVSIWVRSFPFECNFSHTKLQGETKRI